MLKDFKVNLFFIFCAGLLFACSDSETPQEKGAAKTSPVAEAVAPVETKSASEETMVPETADAPVPVEETAKEVKDVVSTTPAETTDSKPETVAVSGDKPYQIVDGKISANAIEGWKTYNGGGCGACHGRGASGGVGPNLGQSVTTKLTKEQFIDVVTNGRPGTLMGPHKSNKRVMDNLDNLYAYLTARGDGVLGPENLIKFPMGKK